MALTQEQLDILATGGDVDFGLPANPGTASADGIFFQDVSFNTEEGDNTSTPQGQLSLDATFSINSFSASDVASFIARNATVSAGDNFGFTGGTNAVFSLSGPQTQLSLLGTQDGTGGLRLGSQSERTSSGTIFVSDGAQVTLDTGDATRGSSVHVGVNFGAYQRSDGTVEPSGKSVDGTLVVEGAGTNLTILNSAGGDRGSFQVGSVFSGSDGLPETVADRSADGLAIIRGGAEVNIHQFVGVGTTGGIDGATANGTLIVEGDGTTVTVGNEARTGEDGFMRVAEQGGQGTFILRDGAEFQLLTGENFGAGLQLSGASEREGGDATALVSGEGTRLVVEKGSIVVGRNVGEATFTASDGATVESLFFTSGNAGSGNTVFEGEGTSLILSGEQLTPEFGAFLTIGRDAEGSFTLRDGADVTITGAGDNSTFPGLQAGRNDGGVGVLTVTGAGSTVTVDGSAITDQGNGETGFIRAGRDAGSDGTINVLDGGVIANDPNGIFLVASNAGSIGTVTVDGAGSVLDFGANAFLSQNLEGGRGDSTVTVSNGGLLRGGTIENNGILDVTSGGQLEANVTQQGLLRSSAGVENVAIAGDLSFANFSSISVDVSFTGASSFAHDTYSATGAVNLDGELFVIASSLADVRGLSAELISGASLTANENFVVKFIETDGNAITSFNGDDVATALANAAELLFTTTSTGLFVDFGTDTAQAGTEVGEALAGTTASDRLEGLGGDDTFDGQAGNDVFVGGAGDDVINGGDGIDTAVYSGSQQSYSLTLTATGATLQDRRADQNGTDTLSGIEFLDFDTGVFGGSFDLNTFAGAASLSQDDFESFIELYIAYFNRAPDAIGLNFWATSFVNGTSLEDIASLFIDQNETRALYPEDQSNSDFATAVYNNVLGRVPDQDGFDFWVGVLDNPESGVTRDQFIREILAGAKAEPNPSASQEFIDQQLIDQKFLSDKTDIGAYYSVHQGLSDVANATTAMAAFDGSQASIDAAIVLIDDFNAEALDAENGEFIMPLFGVLVDPFSSM